MKVSQYKAYDSLKFNWFSGAMRSMEKDVRKVMFLIDNTIVLSGYVKYPYTIILFHYQDSQNNN